MCCIFEQLHIELSPSLQKLLGWAGLRVEKIGMIDLNWIKLHSKSLSYLRTLACTLIGCKDKYLHNWFCVVQMFRNGSVSVIKRWFVLQLIAWTRLLYCKIICGETDKVCLYTGSKRNDDLGQTPLLFILRGGGEVVLLRTPSPSKPRFGQVNWVLDL